MRMLVVDDEVDIANMLAEYFRMEGYDVVCANNGPEALAAASAGVAPDIMLLDVNMPGMDGFEVCRRVREHLSCPIIFLTARVEDVDQLDGFAAGADDYVMKPFSLEVLGRRVAAHMAREGRVRERENAVRFFRELTIDYRQRTVEVRPVDEAGGESAAAKADAISGTSAGVGAAAGSKLPGGTDAPAGAGAAAAPVGTDAPAGVGAAAAPVGTDAPAGAGAAAAPVGTDTPAGVGAAAAPGGAGASNPVFADLTKLEFDIIALLSKRPGQVFDRDVIYERVWGWDAAGDPSQVREHVRRIRNKLAAAGVVEDPIETVWGVGYKWVAK